MAVSCGPRGSCGQSHEPGSLTRSLFPQPRCLHPHAFHRGRVGKARTHLALAWHLGSMLTGDAPSSSPLFAWALTSPHGDTVRKSMSVGTMGTQGRALQTSTLQEMTGA